MSEQTVLPLEKIRIDGETQTRVEIDEATVKEYAEASEHTTLPRSEVVFDGVNYWLWDGFHRYHAARRRKAQALACNVIKGTLDDARRLACGANKSHGLKRTNADKRKTAGMALKWWPNLSDRAIAEHCGVGHSMVSEMRSQLSESDSCPPPAARTGRDGRKRKVKPPKAKQPAPPPEPEEPQPTDEESQAAGEAFIAAAHAPPVLCELGQSVPREFLAAWAAREPLAALAKAMRLCEKEVTRLCADHPGAHDLRAMCQLSESGGKQTFRLEHLRTARQKVEMASPYTVCPYCWHDSPGTARSECTACRGSGVVPKASFQRAAQEYQVEAKNRDALAAKEAS